MARWLANAPEPENLPLKPSPLASDSISRVIGFA